MLYTVPILKHLASIYLLRLVERHLKKRNLFLVKPFIQVIIYRRCRVVVVQFRVACRISSCISSCISACISAYISASVKISSSLKIYQLNAEIKGLQQVLIYCIRIAQRFCIERQQQVGIVIVRCIISQMQEFSICLQYTNY